VGSGKTVTKRGASSQSKTGPVKKESKFQDLKPAAKFLLDGGKIK
jgi:hypothetical protein